MPLKKLLEILSMILLMKPSKKPLMITVKINLGINVNMKPRSELGE
jgi:hypothetical protein